MFCAQQAAEFRAHQSEIESRGARLFLIGNGNPAQAEHFRIKALGLGAKPMDSDPVLWTDDRNNLIEVLSSHSNE